MNPFKIIFSRPYLLFAISLLSSTIYYFSKDGLNAIVVIIFHLFYFPIIFVLFSFIKYRLTNLFISTPIELKTIQGYIFIFTYFLPWLAIPIAIISKLFNINENKKFLITDNYGDTITGIRSANPTLVYKRGRGNEEEIIVMTKYKKRKG